MCATQYIMTSSPGSDPSENGSDNSTWSGASATSNASQSSVSSTYSIKRFQGQSCRADVFYAGETVSRRSRELQSEMDVHLSLMESIWSDQSEASRYQAATSNIAENAPHGAELERPEILARAEKHSSPLVSCLAPVKSDSTASPGKDWLQVQRTAATVFLLVTYLSCVQLIILTQVHASQGAKRKYGDSQNTQPQINHSLSSPAPGRGKPSGGQWTADSASSLATSTSGSKRRKAAARRLGDIFYKFDPVKYWKCACRGSTTTRELFRRDEHKHLSFWHVKAGHLSYHNLRELHQFDPWGDEQLRNEAQRSGGDREVFIWRYKFIMAYPSFIPYRAMLNPWQGEPLLPEDFDDVMRMLQLLEYRRCDGGDATASINDPGCHVLASDGQRIMFIANLFFVGFFLGQLSETIRRHDPSLPTANLHPEGPPEIRPSIDEEPSGPLHSTSNHTVNDEPTPTPLVPPDSLPTAFLTDESLTQTRPTQADDVPSASNVPSQDSWITEATGPSTIQTPPDLGFEVVNTRICENAESTSWEPGISELTVSMRDDEKRPQAENALDEDQNSVSSDESWKHWLRDDKIQNTTNE
ncbi:uncharacterized protein PV06_10263 [Exophiala oligosperma]|uniref:Uncharacterized protein n=1 Tax=Exophiala oligosperma TaxID=215243 RepID=A0A0D2BJP3_9EURO|nr:uncharacterized protein PV06_10263 [Exophiala oligosperma]KIW37622.1 hypothetical protein PV06_10263 [Exophiala oligosperma]